MPDMSPELVFDKLFRTATRPKLVLRVTTAGTPIDFSVAGMTITFEMRDIDTDAVKVDNAAATGDANGGLSYSWASADTNTTGTFKARFKIVDTAGDTIFYPRNRWITVVIGD